MRAEHTSETGTALEITKGAIRVKGAGLNTTTAVFWTRAADMAPSAGSSAGIYLLTIDHPLANGDPKAIITATPRAVNSEAWLHASPERFTLRYNVGAGRWQIVVQYMDELLLTNRGWNILIVKS